MKILVLNGPNLNMLGIREKNLYGSVTYDQLVELIRTWSKDLSLDVEVKQSNHEGDLVTYIQNAYFEKVNGIVINAGAYTHTSIAILDALKAVMIPTIEIHITNIEEREDFRRISYLKKACFKSIMGEGVEGYHHALKVFAGKE